MAYPNDPEEEHRPPVADESRRRFLGVAAGTVSALVAALTGIPLVGMFFGPLFTRRKELWLDIGAMADVNPAQPTKFTYIYVKIDGWFEKTVHGTVYVVAEKSGLIALSNICTHLGCPVHWDNERNAFICPCHNGVYDRQGNVVSGPPPRPLDRFKKRIAKGHIEILIAEV